jgi:hypothetical protein
MYGLLYFVKDINVITGEMTNWIEMQNHICILSGAISRLIQLIKYV